MDDRGHYRHGPKRGGAAMPLSRKLGPCLIQCGLNQGPPPYQVPSLSIWPFCHNRHGPKIGGSSPFLGRGLGPHLSRSIYLSRYIYKAVTWHIDRYERPTHFCSAQLTLLSNPSNLMLCSALQTPRKWPFTWRHIHCSNTCSLDPQTQHPHTASRLVQLFLLSSWQRVPIFYNVCVKMQLTDV